MNGYSTVVPCVQLNERLDKLTLGKFEMEKIIKFTRLLNTRQKIVKEVFEVFYKALKGKCLIVYFGLFKEVMTKFKNGELDEY